MPLSGATDDGGPLRVPYDKAQVKDAPKVDPDGELSQQRGAELYRHYGLDYGESRSDSGLPEGGRPAHRPRPAHGTDASTGTAPTRAPSAATPRARRPTTR